MILNVITMVTCFAMLILFRKLDKSNAKMTKLRRYAKKSFDDFQRMADDEGRKFRDATIEMDILIKKSDSLTSNLSRTLGEIENRIQTIETERDHMMEVSNQIHAVNSAAGELDQHIDYIQSAKKDLKGMSKKISSVQVEIETVKENAGKLITGFENRLKERSREMTEEIQGALGHFHTAIQKKEEMVLADSDSRIEELKENFSSAVAAMELQLSNASDAVLERINNRVDRVEKTLEEATELSYRINSLKEMMDDLENQAFSDIQTKSEEMKQAISASMDEFDRSSESIRHEIQDFATSLSGSKDKILESFRTEIQDMKENLDEMTSNAKNDITLILQEADSSRQDMIAVFNNESDTLRQELREISMESQDIKDSTVQSLHNEADRIKTVFTSESDTLRQQLQEISIESREIKDSIIQSLKDEAGEIREELTNHTDEMSTAVKSMRSETQQARENMKEDMKALNDELTRSLREKGHALAQDMDDTISGFAEQKKILMEGLTLEVDRVHDKIRSAEETITSTRQQLIKTFEQEVDRVRSELDNLSIHAISKKDEIVQAARKEAEVIRNNIDSFRDQFEKMEEKIASTADEKLTMIQSEFTSMEDKLAGIVNNMTKQEHDTGEKLEKFVQSAQNSFSAMEDRLHEIKNEVIEYEEKNRIFSRTDELVEHVSASINRLQELLDHTQKETAELKDFQEELHEFKEARKELDRELRSMHNQKEAVHEMEAEIQGLLQLSDITRERSEQAQKSIDTIEKYNAQMELLSKTYEDLHGRIMELQEYEDIISRNLDSVSKSEQLSSIMEKRIGTFQKDIDKVDKKVDRMNSHLKTVEESTLILKSREREIKDVNEKFSELDGLIAHIEERMNQVNTMFSRVETLKDELESTDSRIQHIFHETDKRMNQFASYIQTVDKNNPIIKEVKGVKLDKNINKNVINTVRELSDKGWTPSDISDKMMLDENSVRLIINTASL